MLLANHLQTSREMFLFSFELLKSTTQVFLGGFTLFLKKNLSLSIILGRTKMRPSISCFRVPYSSISPWISMISHHFKKKRRYGGFQNWGYPQTVHFNETFHHKPSTLGTSICGKPHLSWLLLSYYSTHYFKYTIKKYPS